MEDLILEMSADSTGMNITMFILVRHQSFIVHYKSF